MCENSVIIMYHNLMLFGIHNNHIIIQVIKEELYCNEKKNRARVFEACFRQTCLPLAQASHN